MSLLDEVEPLQSDTIRLQWLLRVLPGDVLRNLVGELSDTADMSEFRTAIDAAQRLVESA